MVTAFFPLTMTGPGETVFQAAGETRFMVDCKVNPAELIDHVTITLVPERMMVNCGALTDPKERLNSVPWPELPPLNAVPYRVLLDKIKLA